MGPDAEPATYAVLAAEGGDVAPAVSLVGKTRHIGQITGSKTNPYDGLGFIGTDLGISYQRDEKLYFLFGDSWTTSGKKSGPNKDLDSVAWADAAQPDGVPKLHWYTRPNSSQFLPLQIPGVPSGAMSVPVEGIPFGSDTYFFFYVTDLFGNVSSALAHSSDEEAFGALKLDHRVSGTHFNSVSTVADDENIWIYGAGDYRNSNVYLARVTERTLADRSTWKYYNAQGQYVAGQSNAAPLFDANDNCVGELSVRQHPTQSLYFMTYNCGVKNDKNRDVPPHEIRLRVARHPDGPWSEALTIFEAHEGDGVFVHASDADTLGEPTREGAGDVYGPYLIPAWFSEVEAGQVEIAYTLSSWNPYQVHLMRTRVAISGQD